MPYDGRVSYISGVLAAQNVIHTASGHVATSTLNATVLPISEPTYLVSIALVNTLSSGSQPSGIKYLLLQTNTTSLGQVAASAGTLNAVSTATFNPGVAIPGATWINFVVVATGTASATETASAVSFIIGVAPQFT